MIVWLASFPRSGNTYLRIALNRMFGVRSSVAYDFDGVARRLGEDFVGLAAEAGDRDALRSSTAIHFIKTHRQRDESIKEVDRAICLVRDGRDALVSYARLVSEGKPVKFEPLLADMIQQSSSRGTGSWGANVLSWLQPSRPDWVAMRFEELVQAPTRVVQEAMSTVAPSLTPLAGAVIPDFEFLSRQDSGFFRRGISGSWRDEMPKKLHDLFWAGAENQAAMEALGYPR
jgi:hypothetical protein